MLFYSNTPLLQHSKFMAEALLKVEGISKEFSGVRVLNDVHLELQEGEIFGIIGENGAGKSTFVKIMSGVYRPSAGKMYMGGTPVDVKNPIVAKKLEDVAMGPGIDVGRIVEVAKGLCNTPADYAAFVEKASSMRSTECEVIQRFRSL